MIQLMFNDNFSKIIEEPINYWKTMENVPQNIKNFIKETSNKMPLYDENTHKYYCSTCLKVLDNNNCPKCSKRYIINELNQKKKMEINNIKKIKDYETYANYYVFDIQDDNIIIYIFKERIYYYNSLSTYPIKMSDITIDSIYHVLSDKIVDLKKNECFYYKDLEKFFKSKGDDLDNLSFIETDIYDVFEVPKLNVMFLFTENLEKLKNTKLYKYTNFWDLKEYLSKNDFTLSTLTYNPIYCKQFEYLVKMKLYNLACNYPSLINYNHDFKKTFGVDKKYYPFMVQIDIGYYKLEALRICPTTDLDLLDFVASNLYLSEKLSKYIKFDKLKKYFETQNLNKYNINEYYDYIRCCEELKLNLNDNNILFPKNFKQEHDKVTSEVIVAKNPDTNDKIKKLSIMLKLNRYEDDKFIIFPAENVESLVDESSQQSNCVRTYCPLISNNECQIYFMRYKNEINKSLVTIEVKNGKIVQARTKFNEEPTEEIITVLKKWEQTMVPITKIKEST